MNFYESILIALDSIRVNKLRAGLTLLSIAIGVFAIIVAMGLVRSINTTVSDQMAELGENTFSVFRVPKIQLGGNAWRMYRNRKPLTYRQAEDFKKQMTSAFAISANSTSTGHTIKYMNSESNPDVSLIGTDADYFITNNINIADGRSFYSGDIDFNRNVVIIGNDISILLFPGGNAIGKDIIIGKQKYTVVGITEAKGAILGKSQDNYVIIPLTQFLKYYSERWEESLNINVKAGSKDELRTVIDEAIGILRGIRDVQPWEMNSFELETNESLALQFESITGFLSIFGFVSGIIALIAAGIGIMNIMLVTIKERTREIGIRKALGARKFWIMSQFITETITLSQIGGFIGIGMGLGLAALFSNLLGLSITIPVDWIIFSIVICTVLGVVFGAYPAWKAANLDPIDALRYE
ncbi:MAG: ABC transporter permease [Candidatus Kapabacteria bacterium]|nr:ABC transporter permease [Ignavibacteriota bacterium]MCW5884481.1 ABC transporter permease [Candidatus Kapabacteria bacterium]